MAKREGEDIQAECSSDAHLMANGTAAANRQNNQDDSQPLLTEKGLKWYWKTKNSQSLDGLAGLETAYASKKTFDSAIAKKDWGKDDESISHTAQVVKEHVAQDRVDTKLAIGFVLGVCASALSINLVNAVGHKIRNW